MNVDNEIKRLCNKYNCNNIDEVLLKQEEMLQK